MTLKLARHLLRKGEYANAEKILDSLLQRQTYPKALREEAIKLLQTLKDISSFGDLVAFSRSSAPTTSQRTKSQEVIHRKPYKCIVISWDANHNCLGRAFVVAKVAEQTFKKVDLLGFDFKHLGQSVWEPLANSTPRVTLLKAYKDSKALIEYCWSIAPSLRADAVIVCKPRFPSILLGCLIKLIHGCTLIVDIDDYEIGFLPLGNASESYHDTSSLQLGLEASARISEPPYSPFWTYYAERLIDYSDEIIVSNTALQKMYGGLVLPHVRDQRAYLERQAQRNLGLIPALPKESFRVMYLGTPRRHKGVVELAKACSELKENNVVCIFAGLFTDRGLKNDVAKASSSTTLFIGNVPFETIPEYLAEADLIVLLQDPTSKVSDYQLPAKAIDAIASGKMVLSTDVEPMRMLEEMGFRGLFFIQDMSQLVDSIRRAMATSLSQSDIVHNNQLFAELLSYEAGSETLRNSIKHVASGKSIGGLGKIINHSSGLLQVALSSSANDSQRRHSLLHSSRLTRHAAAGRSVVILWKQNDFGVFGRRVDMIAKYLSSRHDVDNITVIEPALSEQDLSKLNHSNNPHHRLLYSRLTEKIHGSLNLHKCSFIIPIVPHGLNAAERRNFVLAFIQVKLLELLADGRYTRDPVLWIYPKFDYAQEISSLICPTSIVCDVVDDHRKWPGVSDQRIQELTRHYEDILQLSDLSLYNCESTLNDIGSISSRPKYLIPNGVDLVDINRYRQENHIAINSLKNSFGPRKIIGYAGNLESKIDWALIERLAEELDDCIVLLIGSTHNTRSSDLVQKQNIHYAGPFAYDELLDYLCVFDVAIVPHLTTPLTVAMNPLKMYVYANLQIPIISSRIPNIPSESELPQLCIADSHSDFIRIVQSSLASKKSSFKFVETEFARANCWSTRLEAIANNVLSR
jgi:glycosyltransferase involved in cell wall biosynthesis